MSDMDKAFLKLYASVLAGIGGIVVLLIIVGFRYETGQQEIEIERLRLAVAQYQGGER